MFLLFCRHSISFSKALSVISFKNVAIENFRFFQKVGDPSCMLDRSILHFLAAKIAVPLHLS